MTDPLGRSQVLPYLVGLAARGHQISLISFEKPGQLAAAAKVREICQGAGVDWHAMRYHKRPPILSSMFDIAVMNRRAARLLRRERFELIHCRSYLTATAGSRLKRRFGVPLLFDIRGFWVDERVEMGLWPLRNPMYRAVHGFFKRLERRLFHEADAIVSLTNEGRKEIATWPGGETLAQRTTVIPCCVDFRHFDPCHGRTRTAGRNLLGLEGDTPLLVYLGSLGGNHLLKEMLDLFAEYRRVHPGARFLLVTHHPAEEVVNAARARGIGVDDLIIRSAAREEVPLLVGAADLGVAFKRASYSAKACSPTKIGEMLAMGIPVIANAGVGDTEEIIGGTGAGIVIDAFDSESLSAAIRQVEAAGYSPDQIREQAFRRFELEDGINRYDAIYRAIPSDAA